MSATAEIMASLVCEDINRAINDVFQTLLDRAPTLVGMTEAEVMEAGDEVINDAIGEITNMTVGNFKNGLCDAGCLCRLTLPSILRGSNFSVEPVSKTTRFICNFKSPGTKVAKAAKQIL
jgi:CheY-specific phosphatase CheX